MRRLARSAAAVLTMLAVAAPVTLLTAPASAAPTYDSPVEDYAPYQPQEKCHDTARPGTQELAEWIDARFEGGPALASIRACGSGGVSEHKDGRAIDWMMDAGEDAQRREVRRFLDKVFATDDGDNAHARARRRGIMYVIGNDRMWASYDTFDREDYLNGSCPSVERCSATLRHRDHVHLSLSRRGGRGLTSWYQRD
jgi:hypothetical protein